MSKLKRALSNASASSSESLINLFKGKKNASELLSDNSIIKKMRIGISYLSQDNKPTFLNNIFGSEFTHTAIQFTIEIEGKTSGVLVQYGKYEYIKQDQYNNVINNIGFPYKEKGGLIFGEMDDQTFESTFCSVGEIPLILTKFHPKITLKKFLNEVKNNNGPWNYDNYDPYKKSCQDFVVASLQVIKPNFSHSMVKLKDDKMSIPVVIEEELEKHEL